MDLFDNLKEDYENFISRMDNLKFKEQTLDYLYLGSIEDCLHLKSYVVKDVGMVELNILEKNSDIIQPEVICDKCSIDTLEVIGDKEELEECRKECEYFFEPQQEIVQKVVYYNPKINSAVVFEMRGDYICGYYGEKTIKKLIEDIYEGGNSVYSFALEYPDLTDKVLRYFNTENSVSYLYYINGEIMGADIELYRDCLNGIDIENQTDILHSLKGKKSESCYHL